MEITKFDSYMFNNLERCELNVFYRIENFKKYNQEQFVSSLKKREFLYLDIEFNEDETLFRRTEPKEETIDEMFKYQEIRQKMRFMLLVHDIHNKLEEKLDEQFPKTKWQMEAEKQNDEKRRK
jgi:hypothetical protein